MRTLLDYTKVTTTLASIRLTGTHTYLIVSWISLSLFAANAQTKPPIVPPHCHQAVGESIVLKVLINHLLDLLDPNLPQAVMSATSLEQNALQLITDYSSYRLYASLTPSDIQAGIINCNDALAILADPLADVELSSITRSNLEQTVLNLRGDLEDVTETNE